MNKKQENRIGGTIMNDKTGKMLFLSLFAVTLVLGIFNDHIIFRVASVLILNLFCLYKLVQSYAKTKMEGKNFISEERKLLILYLATILMGCKFYAPQPLADSLHLLSLGCVLLASGISKVQISEKRK
ncbi:hypothetical protein [Bacillus bombysepticus]|uniref:hypothetical protein n=1 Tax=Bacillus bombysepticus TaxID=658666 RepID=UPI003019C81F